MQYYPRDIASIRRVEYPLLNDVTYLDHAGTTLYAQSLIRQFAQDMRTNLFGNPHSASPSSHLSTVRVEGVRERLLRFFKADPEHFDLIFVANATAAIKVVVDAFRDVEDGFWYGYHRDAHTSIVGVRQLATESRCFASDMEVDEWLQESRATSHATSLFAYPAQSNMCGHRTPLEWPGRIRSSAHHKTYTLLDAAAYVMTAPLDLSNVETAPDFTVMSFYKIFGFPDLGALIVRKSTGDILGSRRFFGGGTVDMVIALEKPWHAMKDRVLHEQLEDGTLPFHSIAALDSSLNVFSNLFGTMENVSKHTCELALNLYSRLSTLCHSNGQRVCHFYKDRNSQYGNAKTQGPTLAFNLLNAQGGWIGKSDVERLAILHDIHLRTGTVCNPGGIAAFCNLEPWEMRRNYTEGMRCGDELDILGGKPTGIIRVSFGAMSSLDDVRKFFKFVVEMFVEIIVNVPATTKPSSTKRGNVVVKKLHIFPVLGCAGFEVGQSSPWPIGSTGLSWDREWCIVSTDDGRLLDSKRHPAMMTIKPHLDVAKGILRLVADRPYLASDPMSNEITVCIWETPASGPHQQTPSHPGSKYRPFDAYTSTSVQDFFTTHLGIPCTLARFQHPSKTSEGDHTSSITSVVTVSISPNFDGERQALTTSNITIHLPDRSDMSTSFHYLRIGDQFFEVPGSPTPDSFIATHLPNSTSQSPASQDPTLFTNSTVQFYTRQTATHDLNLAKAIASSQHSEMRICPVWHCRRAFSQKEELGDHLHSHVRKTKPSISAGAVSAKASQTPSLSTLLTRTNMSGMTMGTMDTADTTTTNMSLMQEAVAERLYEKGGMDVSVTPVSLASTPPYFEERELDSQEIEVRAATKKGWNVKIWRRGLERALNGTRV